MKKGKSAWTWYTLTGVLLLVGTILYIRREYYRKVPDTGSMETAYRLTANELFSAFSKNEKEANLKCLDKVITVSGNVKQLDKNEEGAVTIVLSGGSDMSSVRCCMDSVQASNLKDMPLGTPVSVKGICTGYTADELVGSDVILKRCIVSN